MEKILVVIGMLLYFNSCTQSFDCEKLKSEEFEINENSEKGLTELYRLMDCGLDSIEVLMITKGPLLQIMYLQNPEKKDKFTYGEIISEFNKLKKEPEFAMIKERVVELESLIYRIPNKDMWSVDKAKLLKFNFDSELISEIENMINNDKVKGLSYEKIMLNYQRENPPSIGFDPPDVNEYNEAKKRNRIKKYTEVELEGLLEISRKEQKKIIYFFHSDNSINSIKMEALIDSDEVYQLIEDKYIFVQMETEIIHRNERDDLTKEQENMNFQMNKFGTNMQPFFAKLDFDGNLIKAVGQVDKEVFMKFLNNH